MSKKRKPIFTMQNPASDVLRTFKGTFVPTTVMVIVSLILGTFLSGLVYQYVAYTFGKMRRFAAINSFYYGINRTFIVSLIIACTIFYSYYKVLRMFEGRKIDYDTGIIKSDKETFGGAHWQVEEELQDTFHISKKIADTTDEIFGQDEEGRIYGFIYPPGMNHNKLLFGAPGSGKTASVVKTDIYQALLRGESVITTDSKGSVYEETSAVAKELGAIVKVLNLKDKEFNNSNGWNCMSHLDPNSSTFSSDLSAVFFLLSFS